jgi:hypothetical protein
MTTEERSLLEGLDKILRSNDVRERIQPIVARVRADLARKPVALMAWEPVALETFGMLPPSIRSGWVFVLRAGVDTGAERHPNSHQRMLTYAGTGDMKIDIKEAPNEVVSESEIVWRPNILVSDPVAPLEHRWISIPKNIWHRPVVPKGNNWVVVSFHTVPAEELIEERPDPGSAVGTKQMVYLNKK